MALNPPGPERDWDRAIRLVPSAWSDLPHANGNRPPLPALRRAARPAINHAQALLERFISLVCGYIWARVCGVWLGHMVNGEGWVREKMRITWARIGNSTVRCRQNGLFRIFTFFGDLTELGKGKKKQTTHRTALRIKHCLIDWNISILQTTFVYASLLHFLCNRWFNSEDVQTSDRIMKNCSLCSETFVLTYFW